MHQGIKIKNLPIKFGENRTNIKDSARSIARNVLFKRGQLLIFSEDLVLVVGFAIGYVVGGLLSLEFDLSQFLGVVLFLCRFIDQGFLQMLKCQVEILLPAQIE
jgi:hypothetical protein